MESFVFGQDLAAFWGDYSAYESLGGTEGGWDQHSTRQKNQAKDVASQANLDKKRGLYVDVAPDTETVFSPADIDSGTIAEDLQLAAQVVEMLLITDHSRMKLMAQTPYDSTHVQQHRLLPISHPEDWEAASDTFKQGDHLKPPEEQ